MLTNKYLQVIQSGLHLDAKCYLPAKCRKRKGKLKLAVTFYTLIILPVINMQLVNAHFFNLILHCQEYSTLSLFLIISTNRKLGDPKANTLLQIWPILRPLV